MIEFEKINHIRQKSLSSTRNNANNGFICIPTAPFLRETTRNKDIPNLINVQTKTTTTNLNNNAFIRFMPVNTTRNVMQSL